MTRPEDDVVGMLDALIKALQYAKAHASSEDALEHTRR